jgi:hypothetical protein
MTRPIADTTEVALEYPDKFYVGRFDRTSRFDAHLDATGVSLMIECPDDENVRKSIHMQRQSRHRAACSRSPNELTLKRFRFSGFPPLPSPHSIKLSI